MKEEADAAAALASTTMTTKHTREGRNISYIKYEKQPIRELSPRRISNHSQSIIRVEECRTPIHDDEGDVEISSERQSLTTSI